ncbi:hypothetical protein AK830_g9978 [Neonectria ditissima]|uniref:Aminoglycoside phosphotransferase domain-containing protein n=1 Tax=Neonectria ditissima TaxID=78410 RepID=A0A0P7B833_9HYPO|nr:hypothetical protein AK830_g9978 [Neonectria ditissima]
MSSSSGPQQLNDRIVQYRVHRERDEFIASIRDEDVLRLAASYHNDDTCDFFTPPTCESYKTRGSYNICYFVEFEDGEQWVVRIPLKPCLAFGAQNKLENEIAVMQLVHEKTTIPLPTILASKLGDGPGPLSSFLILEYVDGQKLSSFQLQSITNDQRQQLYNSLADIYMQLRRLEFPSIGCITGEGKLKKPATIDLNMQELEGLGPSRIQDLYYTHGPLTSANKYTTMQLNIVYNAFLQSRNSVFDLEVGKEALYHQHLFRRFAERWVDCSLDSGPFVLVHGDLEPFNILVNEDMEIISVLDWEWSRVVPCQYFLPPLWLKIVDTTRLAWPSVYEDWLNTFDELQAVLKSRELEVYGNDLLHEEWRQGRQNGGFLIANALESWTDVDWVAYRYIGYTQHEGKDDLMDRVRMFMEEDVAHESTIWRKLEVNHGYEAELARLRQERSRQAEPGSDNRDSASRCAGAKMFLQLHKLAVKLISTPLTPRVALTALAVAVTIGSLVPWRRALRG